jgi:hypothetical protein
MRQDLALMTITDLEELAQVDGGSGPYFKHCIWLSYHGIKLQYCW